MKPGETMLNHLRAIFMDRREGKIVLFGSLAYLLVLAIDSITPALLHIPPFYVLMSPYMPLALGLTYYQMDGFKRREFQSDWFKSGILIVVLLTPFLVMAWLAITR